MSPVFEDTFKFSLGEDYYYRVDDYTPATLHREHTHEDIEVGLSRYTSSWELIDSDDTRRRGSDQLYLVDDEHYVWCSRTGMESSGNVIKFSQSAPESLRFTVLTTVFERIATRKFSGEDDTEHEPEAVTVETPEGFLLDLKLTTDEQSEYQAEQSSLTKELLSKYESVETVNELEELVDWCHTSRKDLFNEYIRDDDPTALSQAVNTISLPDDWAGPEEVSPYTHFELLMYDDDPEVNTTDSVPEAVLIIIDESKRTVKLVHETDFEDAVIREQSYDSHEELQAALREFFDLDIRAQIQG